MKKILPLLIFAFISTQAQVLDAIAIDVEGEPITTLEIQAVQQKLKMSKQAAVETLIKDRLEKSAIKKANIVISREEVQAKVNAIAASKGLSEAKMRELLTQKGLTWSTYIEQLTTEMKKERFFQEVILSTIDRPSDDELENYYNTHKEAFSNAVRQMSLVAYKSDSAMALQQAMSNPMQPTQGVSKENILASSNEMSPALLNLIDNTSINTFTKPVKTAQGFMAYYVKSKGSGQTGFAAVKNAVAARWVQEQRIQAGQDFLNKLKSNAKIRVIRL
ncbi:MAG: Possible periplasmic protein [uncultured Sulfurovum sp.]|uniref:Possible periplasmic protein n=1 Tax=uncultured Sulfurovum sp. TaxID=269237 RepID=A0A6S6T852_9BACT|nr:MAG: Possible periplasmic protein [uncultured Sulfurovum sp.]